MIGAVAYLLVVVAIAAVVGLVLGRMIARRIDRWQVRAEQGPGGSPADGQDLAEKERVDDADSA